MAPRPTTRATASRCMERWAVATSLGGGDRSIRRILRAASRWRQGSRVHRCLTTSATQSGAWSWPLRRRPAALRMRFQRTFFMLRCGPPVRKPRCGFRTQRTSEPRPPWRRCARSMKRGLPSVSPQPNGCSRSLISSGRRFGACSKRRARCRTSRPRRRWTPWPSATCFPQPRSCAGGWRSGLQSPARHAGRPRPRPGSSERCCNWSILPAP
jgi:hypothetical protein